jgi:hypothetical protein
MTLPEKGTAIIEQLPRNLTNHTAFTVPADVLGQTVDGRVVVLNLTTGQYYGLNEIGSRIWGFLTNGSAFDQAIAALLLEYDISEARLRADMLQFVRGLLDAKLLEASGGEGS